MKELTEYLPPANERKDLEGHVFSLATLLSGLVLALGLEIMPVTAVGAEPGRGIAILASDIGQAYPVASLQEFVIEGGFSSVIIDWAWITYHWDITDFAAVRDLVRRLDTNGVTVAAMYRPRFLGAPTVPEQVDEFGRPVVSHGHYPCFSSAAAREWSWSWGARILTNCPDFNEVVIYNPLDLCQCAACRTARTNDYYGSVWSFLLEAKNAWRATNAAVQLGVVFGPDHDFWVRGRDIVDVARPFFVLRNDADLPANMTEILDVRSILGSKLGPVLAKVTWEPEEIISTAKLSEFMRLVRQQNVAWSLWTFDSLFLSDSYDPAVVSGILGLDYQAIEPALRALRGSIVDPGVPSITFPPAEPAITKLPWPHQAPGLSAEEIDRLNRDVWVINNNPLYQSDEAGTWSYFHGGLDIVLTNGTPIYAITNGWVKAIGNGAIVIADQAGSQPAFGWSYAHLTNFQPQLGDFVSQGALLGEVSFDGLAHIHLDKVFSEGAYWSSWRYTCFPDDHFTFLDQEPPTIRTPFFFFENNSDNRLVPQRDGRMAVRGDVDIVVAMRDGGEFAHSHDGGAFGDRLAVTRILYSIGPTGGTAGPTRSFSSFDFRNLRIKTGLEFAAQNYNTRLVRTVYKHFGVFGRMPSGDQMFSYYIISNCPGEIPPAEPALAFTNCCWQTAALDADSGGPLYPDGDYIIQVTAFDSHGNTTNRTMTVTVDNAGRYPIEIRPPGVSQVVVWGLNGTGQRDVPEDLWDVAAVFGGAYHSVALTSAGVVATWGGTEFGQRDLPPGLPPVLSVAVGPYHTLALTEDGRVSAWGDPDSGRTAVPAGLDRVIAVAAGELHTLALREDGTVVAWGSNLSGDGTYVGQATVPPGLSNVIAIAAGASHSLAMTADGRVVGWGDNRLGQTAVPSGLADAVAIASGHSHGLAVRSDGRVVAWGDNSLGQLNVPADLTNVVSVAAGMIHNLALDASGRVIAWGDNRFGQCDVPADLTNVVGIAAGAMHSLALLRGDPLPPLRLYEPRIRASTFSVSLPTMQGKRYALEYKNSLAPGGWTALPPIRGYGYGLLRTVSAPATNSLQRFYRVHQLN